MARFDTKKSKEVPAPTSNTVIDSKPDKNDVCAPKHKKLSKWLVLSGIINILLAGALIICQIKMSS